MTLHVPEDDPAHSDDPERATERSTERSVERLHSHGSASSALEPKAGAARRTGDALLSRFGLDDGSWQQRAARALEDVELGTLAGYRLVRVVARGAQGTVYEAVEPRTSRRVAIKQLRDSATGELSAREMARFERETTALAVGDLDDDGLDDTALVSSLGGSSAGLLRVFRSNGNGGTAAQATYPVGADPRGLAIGDLDSDGFPDESDSTLPATFFFRL